MRQFTFTDGEASTIAHALGVAAERYEEHAREFQQTGQAGREAYSRLIDQFERQAAGARELADRLEWGGAMPDDAARPRHGSCRRNGHHHGPCSNRCNTAIPPRA